MGNEKNNTNADSRRITEFAPILVAEALMHEQGFYIFEDE